MIKLKPILHFIKYTEDMPSENTGGYAKTLFVRIRPKYENDIGIHMHEIIGHVKNWYLFTFGSLFILSTISFLLFKYLNISYYIFYLPFLSLFTYTIYYKTKWGRLREEINAYSIQLKYEPASKDIEKYKNMYADFIVNNYNLNGYISKEEVIRRLS